MFQSTWGCSSLVSSSSWREGALGSVCRPDLLWFLQQLQLLASRLYPSTVTGAEQPTHCEQSPLHQHNHNPPDMDFSIRPANVEDCKDIARMIMELAEYEKVAEHVKITQRDLEQDGFSKNPFFHGIIAEVPEQHKTKDGHTKIGYALYCYSYSSWSGRAVFMEDLYVMPEFRGKGIGKALMSKVAQLGLAAGCNQLNFTVLDWNKSSLDFYVSQGCFNVTTTMGYHCMRCEGEAMERLAQP